jgi:hypothetical protein
MPCHVGAASSVTAEEKEIDKQQLIHEERSRPSSPTCSTGSFVEFEREGL